MAEAALALSIVAVLLGAFACLLSLGTAARVERRTLAGPTGPLPLTGGLPVGTHLSPDVLRAVASDEAAAWAAGPSLLVFGNSDCHACHSLVEELAGRNRGALSGRLAVIDSAAQASTSSSLRPLATADMRFVADDDGSISHVFKVTSMPMSYLIENATVVGTHVGDGAARLLGASPSVAAAH